MLVRLLLPVLVLALLVWGLRRLFGGYPKPPPLRALGGREWCFVEAVSDAMFPAGGAIPPSGREAGLPAYVDDYVANAPPSLQLLMRLLFTLIEQATLFFPAPGPGGRRRFSRLSAEQQMAALEGWRTSSLFPRRLVFTSLRAILCMGYLADPAVLRQLGLAPFAIEPVVADADLLFPPIGQPRSAIRYGPGDLTPPSDGTPLTLDTPLHPAYREAGS